MRRIITLIIWGMLGTVLSAQPIKEVTIDNRKEVVDLFRSAVIMKDSLSQFTVEDIIAGKYDDRFRPAEGYIKMPPGKNAYWLRVRVRSNLDDQLFTFKKYVGTVEAVLYQVADGRVIHKTELYHKHEDKPGEEFRQSVNYEHLILEKGESIELILFVRGVKMSYLPWFFSSEEAFISQVHRNDLFYGFVYGVFALIILYNLILFFRLRELDYLLYSLNMFFLGLLLFNYHGHPYEFLLNGKQYLKDYVEVYGGLAGIFHALFAMVFLHFRSLPKWLRGLFYFILLKYGLDVIFSIAGLSDSFFPWMSSGTTSLLSDFTIMVAAVISAVRGFYPAILFLIARLSLFVTVYISVFYSMGKIPHTEWAYKALHLGAVMEMILFAIAISYKIRLLKEEKIRAQKEKEEFIKSENIRLEKRVLERTRELNDEKDKSEKLLLNILPKSVASEMKEMGFAEARLFNKVTVLFTDFENFTETSQNVNAEELIRELNYFFMKFDEIVTRHGIEKIKTIGDAYMAVGGVPDKGDPQEMALKVVRAAMDMKQFVLEQQKSGEHRILHGMRIGIHTGDAIAGIVGTKKFQYDIWGETVNLAARMESSGIVDKINVSESTYALIKDEISCEHRGKVYAKNIGDVDMYLVQ